MEPLSITHKGFTFGVEKQKSHPKSHTFSSFLTWPIAGI
jgi:hypothetical protein